MTSPVPTYYCPSTALCSLSSDIHPSVFWCKSVTLPVPPDQIHDANCLHDLQEQIKKLLCLHDVPDGQHAMITGTDTRLA